MLDIAEELHRWAGQGRDFAVATVVAVSGSAPRGPGAALAVDSGGAVIGSVSGGCVEGAVYELCRQALEDGATVVERFGYSDDDAFAVGLTCGGVIDILVTPVRAARATPTVRAVRAVRADRPAVRAERPAVRADQAAVRAERAAVRADATRPVFAALEAASRGQAAALARITEGPAELLGRALLVRPGGTYEGSLGGHPELDRTAAAEALALLDSGRTDTVVIGARGSRCGRPLTLLVESSVPPPRMIVFGAVDFASALVRTGKFLGYHVTVCDARPVFATRARFPDADEIVVDWPHRYLESAATDSRTVLCVLTHDAKFDVPLLELALRLPVAYVGAMGSRRTHEDRARRLREHGVTERELARLRSPIGLDLGARTPEETALSIAAEIVAVRRGGSGVPLTGAHTPIHHDEPRPWAHERSRVDSAV
ncbi:XdhC family protein [Streptomyces sp. GMY02]|uniref:XdhC family protein n=1 Tax=Streptomyces sp. GMY02 TaxID=1333528 RepID=UPI001C2BA0D7|nr:XdhC/CoxI family protein [Streptomyces sp. GMY02]QXE34090.1 XdhC family protein [Streptomyces sp. GMY02]